MEDVIGRAVNKGKHISRHEMVNDQTWEMFDAVASSKTIIMFGVGRAADFFWYRSKYCSNLKEITDNNAELHGDDAGWHFAAQDAEGYVIKPTTVLQNYAVEDIVVIITSINYYDEIIDQLRNLGIKDTYVLLTMEANWRKEHGVDDYCISDEEYAQKCESLKIEPLKMVFQSDNLFYDHEKYIALALLKIRTDLDIVWILSDMNTKLPKGIRAVYFANHRKVIYELATSRFFFTNANVPLLPLKKEGQIYIHTKHWASVTLKKFYLDASTITDIPEKVDRWKKMFSMLDYIIVGSEFDEESCRRGFNFSGTFIKTGSPRSDAMFIQERLRRKVVDYYGLPADYKILLYAPTYRYRPDVHDNHIPEVRELHLNFEKIKDALKARFGYEWIIMLRFHPSVRDFSKGIQKNEYLIDVSMYQDGEELVSACDILMTDYSSIMFEPAFVKKTVFLFAPDRTTYINGEYDLLIDYDSLPFPISVSNEELVKNITNFDSSEYESDVDEFLRKYHVHEDGHASERTAEYIIRLTDSMKDV